MSIHLTKEELEAIMIIERACSCLSLVGSILIMITFCASKSFHKPINRLVFYASFGNMLSNVGTLMSNTYTERPKSPQCQFQGFLIQMFMPADAFWALAMAVNVYLTFYHKFDATGLRKVEVPYLIICYGVPFIPAFTYLFVTKNQVSVYGNATLWCWISDEWEVLRIATLYGPVWVSIVVTFIIYIRTGRTIYEKRRELVEADSSASSFQEACGSTKTTDVEITSERVSNCSSNLELYNLGQPQSFGAPNQHYSVTITADPSKRGGFLPHATCAFLPSGFATPSVPTTARLYHPERTLNPQVRRRIYERNNAAWPYTKCSILFFIAILVTWVPSSANRVYSVVHKSDRSVSLEFMSAFVLPLQGFWNAVIYFVTSWDACRSLWVGMTSIRSRNSSAGLVSGRAQGNAGNGVLEDQRALTDVTESGASSNSNLTGSESSRTVDPGTSGSLRLDC